jgi:hypothetical protein
MKKHDDANRKYCKNNAMAPSMMYALANVTGLLPVSATSTK